MTVESSSSSEAVPAEAPAHATSSDAGAEPSPAPLDAQPVVELDDIGIWYRLSGKKTTLRRAVIAGLKNKLRRNRDKHLFWALRHIDLKLYEGQTLGIVGHNGAGKSTLCLALAQILTPDEGTATIRGKVSTLLTLGAGFNQDLSGRANILLYAAYLGIPRNIMDEKLEDIIEFSELGEFIDQPMRTYSRGMRSRLGFAVATELDPDILILDEVLAVGDQKFRAKSRVRMHEMMEKSRLIVIVSHSPSMLREICTHALWLNKGRINQFGEADEVLSAYSHAMGGDDGLGDEDPE